MTRPAPRRAERHHERVPSRHGDLALLRVPPLERPRGFTERGDGRRETRRNSDDPRNCISVVAVAALSATERFATDPDSKARTSDSHIPRLPSSAETTSNASPPTATSSTRDASSSSVANVASPARLITRTRMFSVGPTFSATRTAASAASTASSCSDVARTPGASRERRHGAAARFQLGKPAARAKRRTRVLSRRHAGDSTRWCAAARMPSLVGSLRSSAFVPLYRTTCGSARGATSDGAASAWRRRRRRRRLAGWSRACFCSARTTRRRWPRTRERRPRSCAAPTGGFRCVGRRRARSGVATGAARATRRSRRRMAVTRRIGRRRRRPRRTRGGRRARRARSRRRRRRRRRASARPHRRLASTRPSPPARAPAARRRRRRPPLPPRCGGAPAPSSSSVRGVGVRLGRASDGGRGTAMRPRGSQSRPGTPAPRRPRSSVSSSTRRASSPVRRRPDVHRFHNPTLRCDGAHSSDESSRAFQSTPAMSSASAQPPSVCAAELAQRRLMECECLAAMYGPMAGDAGDGSSFEVVNPDVERELRAAVDAWEASGDSVAAALSPSAPSRRLSECRSPSRSRRRAAETSPPSPAGPVPIPAPSEAPSRSWRRCRPTTPPRRPPRWSSPRRTCPATPSRASCASCSRSRRANRGGSPGRLRVPLRAGAGGRGSIGG